MSLAYVNPSAPDLGAQSFARSKRRYVYSEHPAYYFHAAGEMSLHWRDGQFRHATAHLGCRGNMLHSPVWTDERPDHLAPCPLCFDVVPKGSA